MRRIVLLLALATLLCGWSDGCQTTKKVETETSQPKKPTVVRFVEDEEVKGLRMILREAGAPTEEEVAIPVAEGKPLSAEQTERLLSRVPALTAQEGDKREFARREGSMPPPRTGEDQPV